jgi:hypothetical protein
MFFGVGGSRREFWATRQGLNGPTGLIFHLLMCSSFHGISTTGSCKCFLYLHLSFGDFSFQLVQPVSSVGSFKPCLKVQISDAKHSEYHDQTQREEVARMAKASRSSEKVPKSRAALTPEAREKQLIALAIDVAEEQMRNGTASSQVISHFLKLGSTRAQIEKELLEKQRDLAAAKAEAIESSAKMEDLYLKAAKAMKSYQGQEDEEDEY